MKSNRLRTKYFVNYALFKIILLAAKKKKIINIFHENQSEYAELIE